MSEKDTAKDAEFVERVARRLGMKPAEIVDVERDGDDVLAQTHDGVWTRIRADGELEFQVEGPVRAKDADEATAAAGDPQAEDDKAAAAAKRRGR
ncbi:hypothetical protein GCM10010168_85920 [Actinoplanes ianthinogenes]|uniref:Uncharacterized protein n=1 Tax=Actinoplanes ianthinogenes TaxID=122358 RepID=A0ABM7M125_9ACTN|nr:hypothetical protein [Actinoplanes ianthinogenes]BCJ45323.1 hypothetical protein Aiant_59800 [Actinoplanes ianthinogenes]GGR53774.1 hypothetical protein GCM10010168_85920 [Actinoplanes ianthinogenes]